MVFVYVITLRAFLGAKSLINHWRSATSVVQMSEDAQDECLIVCFLPNSRTEQWRMMDVVTGYTLFLTSYLRLLAKILANFWRNLRIYSTHTYPYSLNVVQCVTVMNINYYQRFKLGDRKQTQQSALPRSSSFTNCKNTRQRVNMGVEHSRTVDRKFSLGGHEILKFDKNYTDL